MKLSSEYVLTLNLKATCVKYELAFPYINSDSGKLFNSVRLTCLLSYLIKVSPG